MGVGDVWVGGRGWYCRSVRPVSISNAWVKRQALGKRAFSSTKHSRFGSRFGPRHIFMVDTGYAYIRIRNAATSQYAKILG